MDPNWFYSSLAQSAATIVGLLASVLVVRLQYQLIGAADSRNRVVQSFLQLRHDASAAMAKLRQIEAYCTDAIPRAEQALHEGKPNIRVNREATFRRSTGDPGYVSVTTSYIEELRNDVTAAHSLLRIYASLIDIKDMTNLSASHRALLNAWADLEPHTVNEAGRFLSRLGALLQQVERHMDQLGTRYTWLLIVVLVWVSIFGVMVPLSLLAARPDSTKLWLASTFGLGLFALPAFLVFQISELRRVGRAELHPEDRPIDIPGD